LYNWYAVVDKRGIAPDGWRVPTKEDWEQLLRFLTKNEILSQIDTIAGPQMRKADTWGVPGIFDFPSNNKSGFDAKAAGYRFENGFGGERTTAMFWSSSEDEQTESPYMLAIQGSYAALENYFRKLSGVSVRLIKIEK
jgi:uncharacterized protein (TIGR02145 family)